jgi:pimeloyl-ACP methyl ester carboxylesterase
MCPLSFQNGKPENTSSRQMGFLSTLLGEGSECHGYKVRVVGHSLGGAIATVLGMMVKLVEPSFYFKCILC